jgi:hypothetical protein
MCCVMECGVDPLPAQVLQVCQPDMAWIMESVTVAGENVVNAHTNATIPNTYFKTYPPKN